jgi:hypothetical protein
VDEKQEEANENEQVEISRKLLPTMSSRHVESYGLGKQEEEVKEQGDHWASH